MSVKEMIIILRSSWFSNKFLSVPQDYDCVPPTFQEKAYKFVEVTRDGILFTASNNPLY